MYTQDPAVEELPEVAGAAPTPEPVNPVPDNHGDPATLHLLESRERALAEAFKAHPR